MKKSILLLGTFALLIATPSIAQENSTKAAKKSEAQPVSIKKAEPAKEEVSLEKQVIKKKEAKAVKASRIQEIKAVEPKRKEEKK